MIVCPSIMGVVLLPWVASKGTCHNSLPSARPRPTTNLAVSVTNCFVEPTIMITGDEEAGPSPVHLHFGDPFTKSKAKRAPLVLPPRCTKQVPSSRSGDMDASDWYGIPW